MKRFYLAAFRNLVNALLVISCSAAAQELKPSRPLLATSLAKPSLRFEPNVGQAEAGVRYVARGADYTMLIKDQELVMLLSPDRKLDKETPAAPTRVVRMNLLSAKGGGKAVAEERLESITNYYIGEDPKKWRPGVANFGRVKLEEVYPGIDVLMSVQYRGPRADSRSRSPRGMALAPIVSFTPSFYSAEWALAR